MTFPPTSTPLHGDTSSLISLSLLTSLFFLSFFLTLSLPTHAERVIIIFFLSLFSSLSITLFLSFFSHSHSPSFPSIPRLGVICTVCWSCVHVYKLPQKTHSIYVAKLSLTPTMLHSTMFFLVIRDSSCFEG